MKVLVTGGSGFIGSHIVDELIRQGVAVRVLDREPPVDPHPAVEVIVGDIGDPSVVAAAVDGVHAVCHQAAKVGLGADFDDVDAYVADNDGGTAALLKALWRRGFGGRLVLASSMVVYGEGRARCPDHALVTPGPRRVADLDAGRFEPGCPHAGCIHTLAWEPVTEDAPLDPRNVYAATKLHQEHLCAAWARGSGASVVGLRYHNVYGPRMPADTPYAGVAAIFRSALANGQAPLVFEDGGQTRDFVHVEDVARANWLALTTSPDNAGAYNVASGSPHTVGDMATAMAEAFGGVAEPMVTGAWRLGDVRHIVASGTRAADRLGFRAEVDFRDGVAGFAHAVSPT